MDSVIPRFTISRHYLGAGVYATYDGENVWLDLPEDHTRRNELALNPQVREALFDFLQEVAIRLGRS